ncbi:MAG TPA: hypothetical protein VGG07_23620 [Solirubrobacteraceae bacterium]|jgi:hypothetical protein
MATLDHTVAASTGGRVRVPGVPLDRITRPAMNVLSGALAAVYLLSAVTMPAGHGAVAAGEAGIAALQLAWLALATLRSRSGWVYRAGVVMQLALFGLWIVTRTTGLPGIGRLPVGEFDLLCALDALVIAALCWRCAPFARPVTQRVRLGLCQLAVVLAATTAYMSMVSMMAMTASTSGSQGPVAVHGQAAPHFFCHLL